MVAVSANAVLVILFEALARSRKTVDQINETCKYNNLPLVFPIDHHGQPQIPGNLDYRFEGMALIIGSPLKLSFYIHYKPDSAYHVALRKFMVPIEPELWSELGRILNGKEFPI